MAKKNQKNKATKKRQQGTMSKTRRFLNSMIIIFLSITLIGGVSSLFMLVKIVSSVDTKNLSAKLVNKEPTIFYASDKKTIIGEIGGESRENVTYDQIPQSTIDAFLSIEDSRYFKHNGFDLPRFLSSAVNNVKSASFVQGGSTLTMQMIDNFIMKPIEEKEKKDGKSTNAIARVEKKIQEIYLSMRIEKELSKEEIITKYLNEINFGHAARGIQRGAQYYFGKNVEALNLAESAFLAGVINAPNTFNPYRGYDADKKINYYGYAQGRRNATLDQMLNHGFITKTEHALAKATKLSFQLGGETKLKSNYQQYYEYVYQATEEVRRLTGSDPATVPMKVYTSLDVKAQNQANKVAAGEAFKLPTNQYYQLGFTVLNNRTGEIVAVSGGRSDIETKASTFRTRYNEEKQPGSTIKPLLDYAPSFDKLGWATSRILEDAPITIDGNVKIQNYDLKYYGDVSMEYALSKSLNTPALRALQEFEKKEGRANVVSYLTSLGFQKKVTEKYNTQFGIGGSHMQASPTQMAAAYATLANGGYYIEPHMVNKVEFKDGSKTIDNTPKKTQVMSPQAAYMTSELLYRAVNGSFKRENLMGSLGFGKYPVYGKTGTTNYDENEPNGYGGMMKDEWMVNYTSEYTIASWTGFDAAIRGKDTAINKYLFLNINGLINKYMLDSITSNALRIPDPGEISPYGGGLIRTSWLDDAMKNNPKTSVVTTTLTDDLRAMIAGAEALQEEQYNAESFANLMVALENAKKVLNNPLSTQADINTAKSDLDAAVQGLLKKPVQKPLLDKLQAAIAIAANYQDTKKYNTIQVQALVAILKQATILQNNPAATQEQIDMMAISINKAIQDCINNPVPSITP